MSATKDGGPAFPQFEVVAGERDGHGDAIDAYTTATGGMSLRAYAAIALRVPNSGIIWLDDMIRQAMQNEFAGLALSGILADDSSTSPHLLAMHGKPGMTRSDVVAKVAVDIAIAMASAMEGTEKVRP